MRIRAVPVLRSTTRLGCSVTVATTVLLAACGTADKPTRESVAADTVPVATAPDTTNASRVVPYDPSAPGAMRNRNAPIRTSGTGGVDTARTRAPAPRASTPSSSAASADSVGDPVGVVREYYAAIRAHDFLRAYRMWETSGQRNARSFTQFAAGFDSTESVEVRPGAPSRVEGATGSRYVTVPVEIDSRLRNGTRQRFTGTYTLRRVVVPGASSAQRRWHLYASRIRQSQ